MDPPNLNDSQEDPLTDGEDQHAENLVTTDEEGRDDADEFPTDDDEPTNPIPEPGPVPEIPDEPTESEADLAEPEKRNSSHKSNRSRSRSSSSEGDDGDGNPNSLSVFGNRNSEDYGDEDYDEDDDVEVEFIKPPTKDLIGDWDLDDFDDNSPDELRSAISYQSIHISKLEISTEAEARVIAEEIIEVLENDVSQYLENAGMKLDDWNPPDPEEIDKGPREKISGSSISISSDVSEPLPGDPSKLRLYYEKGDPHALKVMAIPPIQGHGIDEECDVVLHRSRKWHRTGGRPEKIDVEAQTKEMTFVPESKAQLIFMSMYPKPDNWRPEEIPTRQRSMQDVVDAAEHEDPNVDRTRKGPQIINFTNRKKLLQPLRDDYYKDETFWTGSRFRGEYKNRQFFKGHYDHPTGVKYESEWKDGHFHTTKHLGIIKYPRGDTFEGEWQNGRYVSGQITFGDGLKYQSQDWSYCQPPDRRLRVEKYYGMKPVGNTIYNDTYPSTKLPPGHFDVGDGVYNPSNGEVRGYDGFLLRNTDTQEQEWILDNCRRSSTQDEEYVPSFNSERIPGSYMEQISKFSFEKRKFH